MNDTRAPGADVYLHYPPAPQDDDFIDFVALAEVLWQQKWLVAGVTTLALALALALEFIQSPSYRAEAFLTPPLISQVARIRQTGKLEITAEMAFYRVADQLESLATQRNVFTQIAQNFIASPAANEIELERYFINQFAPRIKVQVGRVDERKGQYDVYASVGFSDRNAEVVATTVNLLAEQAIENATRNIIAEVKGIAASELEAERSRLEKSLALERTNIQDEIARAKAKDEVARLEVLDKIAATKRTAAREQQGQITLLEESFKIAEQLGIEDPASPASWSPGNQQANTSVTLTANLSEDSAPAYLRGTRALSAELQVLKARSIDVYTSAKLRGLQEQLELLDTNRRVEQLAARADLSPFLQNIDELRSNIATLEGILEQPYDDVSLARIEQRAIVPGAPANQRGWIGPTLALVLGSFLGCALALIRNAIANRRAKENIQQ